MENRQLTREQIQSIDTYLKNSDIQFIDVRMELVDHVATALEEQMTKEKLSFYEAFKQYMIINKKTFLSNYKKLKKKNQIKGFKLIWPILKSPMILLLFIANNLFLYKFKSFTGLDFPYVITMWGLLIGTALVYYIFSIPLSKNRFSGLESLSWIIFLWHYVNMVLFNFSNLKPLFFREVPWLINIVIASFICFCISWLITFFKLRKLYRRKYQSF